MNARTQYRLTSGDLEILLAVVRAGSLAGAGERLSVNSSTVFRSVQRIERALGQVLFERSRSGYLPTETAQRLTVHAERLEAEIEAARSTVQVQPNQVTGAVRITSTDTILHGLILPALKPLAETHPRLSFDLHIGNELVNLTKREADIAVRATKRPPPHLVGKHLGPIHVALYAPRKSRIRDLSDALDPSVRWIAPDEALPDHMSVLWRKQHHPRIAPVYRVSSLLTAAEATGLGLGVAVLPVFLAEQRKDVRRITEVLEECQTELWVLTHTEYRHLRRVTTVFTHLGQSVKLS